MKKDDILKKIEDISNKLNEIHKNNLLELAEQSKKMMNACIRIENSWSGSFAGWHGRMYYKNFDAPAVFDRFNGEWGGINHIPDGWNERTPEEVVQEIERIVGNNFSVDNFETEVKNIKKETDDLHAEINILLSVFNFDNDLKKEKELYLKIEDFHFGDERGKYVRRNLPTNMMSRDTEALRQGMCIPSYLYYQGVANEARSLNNSMEKFTKLVQRLIRQINLKQSMKGPDTMKNNTQSMYGIHPEIQKKCHKLYEKGEYPEAVEKSFKIVRDRLRTLTGYETGSDAFGKSKLHITGAAAQNVDEDFNNGVKFLTMSIDRFRNEKSHTSDAKIEDPVRAYEYLMLSSLAMGLLDNAEILP